MASRIQFPDVEPEWTPRQREVLDLLVRGCTNGEIAKRLGISLEGAKFHVSEILGKLQVQTRDEAAEYWRHRNGLRMRFLRPGGAILASAGLRWAAIGAAILVVAAAAGIAIVLLANQDEGADPAVPDVSPTPSPMSTATPLPSTPSASATPGAVLTPFAAVTAVAHVSVTRGETITGGYGLLFGNPNTGGVEAWLLPDGATPAGVSPQGRYFVFDNELIDAWTGTRVPLALDEDAVKASFAPDDSAVLVWSQRYAALFRNDGTLVVRYPTLGAPAGAEAIWSADSRAVALSRGEGPASRTVEVVVDGVLRPGIPSSGMTAWSREGLRLAVTGDRPALYDYESGAVLALERGGTYPAWAGDDAYLAVDIGADGAPGLSALDTATGREVIRLYNRSACFLIYWYEGPALPGVSDTGAIEVPSGDVIPYEARPRAPFPQILMKQAPAGVPAQQWANGQGAVYAEVHVDALWAYTLAWVRRDIDAGFPPVLFLGRGGQDACGGEPAPVVVAKPPFTPDQVPTPTPTPDK